MDDPDIVEPSFQFGYWAIMALARLRASFELREVGSAGDGYFH